MKNLLYDELELQDTYTVNETNVGTLNSASSDELEDLEILINTFEEQVDSLMVTINKLREFFYKLALKN